VEVEAKKTPAKPPNIISDPDAVSKVRSECPFHLIL
jgi:hypothetical protein